MMKLAAVAVLSALTADAAQVQKRSLRSQQRRANPCPSDLENRYPSSLETSYNISKDHGLNPLDAIWDTTKLREAMQKDAEWKIGMQWVLKATFYSDSSVDRTIGFAGPDGGFLTLTIPAGAQGLVKEVSGPVGQAADKLEFQYLAPGNWTSGEIFMTDICLTPQSCDVYECPSHSKLKGKGIFGHSDARCCVQRLCQEEGIECPKGKYTPHANYSTGKAGFNVETCCIPNYCPPKLCANETKWKDKGDAGLVGSTPEDCCEERLCATHTCSDAIANKKLDIWESEGVARKGSTDAECCAPLFCKDFVCTPSNKYGLKPGADMLKGADRDTCCDVMKCDTFKCPNNTKWKPKPGALVGNSMEDCCEKQTCDRYKCSDDSLQLLVNPFHRLGSTDEECCERKSCKDWKCSDPTKWVHRAAQNAPTRRCSKGGPLTLWLLQLEHCPLQQVRQVNTSGCPRLTSPCDQCWSCSTFEQCCEPIFCNDFVCDTDKNGTGVGTQWYKKVNTNTYKWQGSTNEECCLPMYCSQYTTEHPTRWKRKTEPGMLGSSDVECYDPRWCSDYCCSSDTKMRMPNAEKHQGSTDEECCIDKPKE